MKILGKVDSGTLLCEISISEIDKIFNDNTENILGSRFTYNAGSHIDLGKAYDFNDDIKRVLRDMKNAERSFVSAQDTLFKYAQQFGGDDDTE